MSEAQSDCKNLWERHNFAVWRSSSFYLTCVGFGSRHHQYTHCRPKSGHKVKQELDKWPTSIKTSTFLRKQLPVCYFYAWWRKKDASVSTFIEKIQSGKKTKGLAACESQLLFIQKVSWEVGTEPPHCDGQYMVSHSSVGEQSINAEDKNNSTQWWGGWRLTTVWEEEDKHDCFERWRKSRGVEDTYRMIHNGPFLVTVAVDVYSLSLNLTHTFWYWDTKFNQLWKHSHSRHKY